MDEDLIDRLKSLHTHAIDARNGYDEAIKDADGHGLTSLFEAMIRLHTANADELHAEITKAGEVADDDGSFMSTVHRTIISIRSLFGGLDASILPGLIDGEERNLTAYRDTLATPDLPTALRSLLTRQSDRLATVIADMQARRA